MILLQNWINFTQLSILGIEEELVYYAIILLGIITSYLIIQPIISWFVALKSTKLLSYIVSSLIVLVLFFLIVLFVGDLQYLLSDLLKMALQSVSIFGVILTIYYSIRRLIQKQ